jgi:phenylpropionate dioxygenase-like ring-hydroxylating dioxygenase large terminal subunit
VCSDKNPDVRHIQKIDDIKIRPTMNIVKGLQGCNCRSVTFLLVIAINLVSLSAFELSCIKARSCLWPTARDTASMRLGALDTAVSTITVNSDYTFGDANVSKDNELRPKQSFENFDYLAHWYPVSWACDIPLNQPTKITLFDTDYVVARITKAGGADDVIAMLDQCPHKSAALSEGRITAKGNIQCAYHGWSFNGTTGDCVEIPQLVNQNGKLDASISARSCGTAIPAMVQQGMIYLFPGGNLEKALLEPPPPRIPEMDRKDFKVTVLVRDMPVDWPILLENIMDPDHGLFVHHLPSFDWYTASKDFPLTIEEEFLNDGKGWRMTTRVDAVEKLLVVNKKRKGENESIKNPEKILSATGLFQAPYFAVIGRRCKETADTSLLNGFWISPTGTGRSRLLIAFIAKTPVAAPRWLTTILLNNFLDQDTYLIATQHKHVLKREAEQIKKMQAEPSAGSFQAMSNNVRKSLYNYRSSTERSSARIGNFWDSTLHRAPNRIATLLALESRGELNETPPRQAVLDRDRYHLQVCPDSQGVVRNCNTIDNTAKLLSVAMILTRVYATLMIASSSAGWFARGVYRVPNTLVGCTLGLAALASFLARKVRRQFYFKYDQTYHQTDLDKVPQKIWWDA